MDVLCLTQEDVDIFHCGRAVGYFSNSAKNMVAQAAAWKVLQHCFVVCGGSRWLYK
jgi:hypothetical protein